MSYEHRCSLLTWQTLEKRREFLSLVQCYKIVFGFDHLSFPDFFEFAKSTRTRANHNYKLYLRRAVCNCYKYSFFICIVSKWNDLSGYVVHAESLSVFKSRLKIYLNIYWISSDRILSSSRNFKIFLQVFSQRNCFWTGLTSRFPSSECFCICVKASWIKCYVMLCYVMLCYVMLCVWLKAALLKFRNASMSLAWNIISLL